MRALMASERRSESQMLRVLVHEALDVRQGDGHLAEAGAAWRAGDRVQSSPAPDGHPFVAQKLNALKCAECGGKKGEHRG